MVQVTKPMFTNDKIKNERGEKNKKKRENIPKDAFDGCIVIDEDLAFFSPVFACLTLVALLFKVQLKKFLQSFPLIFLKVSSSLNLLCLQVKHHIRLCQVLPLGFSHVYFSFTLLSSCILLLFSSQSTQRGILQIMPCVCLKSW